MSKSDFQIKNKSKEEILLANRIKAHEKMKAL